MWWSCGGVMEVGGEVWGGDVCGGGGGVGGVGGGGDGVWDDVGGCGYSLVSCLLLFE